MSSVIIRFITRRENIFTAAVWYLMQNKNYIHSDNGRHHEELSKREYWKTRYQKSTEKFDWFLSEEAISSLVCYSLINIASRNRFKISESRQKHMDPVNVLDLGCGKSMLPLYYYEWNPFPVAVYCLDYVQEAVHYQLNTLHSVKSGHSHSSVCGICASVCNLPFQSLTFHLITDKGTMDSLLKDSSNGTYQAKVMLSEVERVLQKGGLFMQITDEDPDSRMLFLETNSPPSCQWQFSILTDDSHSSHEYFIYRFSK